jgi:hypothetical protein
MLRFCHSSPPSSLAANGIRHQSIPDNSELRYALPEITIAAMSCKQLIYAFLNLGGTLQSNII